MTHSTGRRLGDAESEYLAKRIAEIEREQAGLREEVEELPVAGSMGMTTGEEEIFQGGGINTAMFGIVIDNENERVQVLERRATLHRYGETPLHWTAASTYLTYADMGEAGDHLITMELDPDVASTATFEIYDSEEADPKPVRARLYTVTLTQVDAGPPVVYSAVLKPPIHGMGDINVIPLFGDHPVEEEAPSS